MQRKVFVILTFLGLFALTGCNPSPSVSGRYNIEQDGYGFGPGADKIILELRSDGSFDVTAGKVTMLQGTWESKSGQVTLSKEQGAIVVNYRIEGSKLIPMKDGKDITGWRWKKI